MTSSLVGSEMCIRDRWKYSRYLLYREAGERGGLRQCCGKTGSLSTTCFSFCCKLVYHVLAVPMQMGWEK
eukprot:6267296-Prorocentrum_lima.AAC.1